MNITNKLLISMLIVSAIYTYEGTLQAVESCQCFCAFALDVRDKKREDTPFIATLTNSQGKTFDICLCAKRDLLRLQQHPSLVDHITDDHIASANCCSQ